MPKLLGHQHPEGADKPDLVRQYHFQAVVDICGEGRQYADARAGGDGLLLGQDAGAADIHLAGAGDLVQEQQFAAEHHVVHVADKPVPAELVAAGNGAVVFKVRPAGVEPEDIVSEFGDNEGPPLRALQGNDNIGFVPGQPQGPGHGQQVQVQVRVATDKVAQFPAQHDGAVALGGADADLAGELFVRLRQALLDAHAGAFHLFHPGQQLAAGLGEAVAGLLSDKQGHAQAFLQGVDAPGHGGVIHAHAPCGSRKLARAAQFQEEFQIIPVHQGFRFGGFVNGLCIFAERGCN